MSDGKKQISAEDQSKIVGRHKLDEVDKKIIAMKLDMPAISNSEIAKLIGLTRESVSRRINKPKWQDAWDKLHQPAKKLMELKADDLMRKYLKLAECGDKKVEERVMRTILVSLGIIKNRVDIDSENFEPLVITMPITQRTITVTTKDQEAKRVGPGEDNG